MENDSQKNKRIAKNTLLLYIRTIFIMLISLYTSRIVLNVLGVEDFGIYNVVGGTIAMFSVFSGSLSSAISRFITFGIGKNDNEQLKRIFSTSITIQIFLSIFICIVAEIVGIWMLNSHLNIPPERLNAAFWVLQFSILTFILGLLSVPYNACIIAHERMSVFAYIGIFEVVLKLIFVALLYFIASDKLILYSFLLFLLSLILRIIYSLYCTLHFEECVYHFILDKRLLKEMLSYASWNFLGNTAYIFNTQGVNVIINMFFGVAFNAARGVVTQVEGAVMQFVNNFMTALSPQITISYASGNNDYMFKLICRGTKFSFYLLFFFLVPIELETYTILKLWLGVVPEQAPAFLQLSLLATAIVLFGNTSYTAIMATGKIRNYQIVVTSIGCLVFPLTLLAYKLGFPAICTYHIYIFIYLILNVIRLLFLKKLLNFKILLFVKKVIYPIILVILISPIIPYILHCYMHESVFRLIVVTVVSFISTLFTISLLGLEVNERNLLFSKVKKILFVKQN